jgi:hypothetical protein
MPVMVIVITIEENQFKILVTIARLVESLSTTATTVTTAT